MPVEILMPALSPTMTEGKIAKWVKAVGDSVHLTDWPSASELPSDPQLVEAMDRVRDVCSAASSVRKAHGIPVRHPLPSLTIAAPDASN